MHYLNRVVSGAKKYCSGINRANMSGAIDVIVIKQPDGTYKSTPFYVRFGKMGVLVPKQNVVEIRINDQVISNLIMRISPTGECYFEPPLSSGSIDSQDSITSSDTPTSVGESNSFEFTATTGDVIAEDSVGNGSFHVPAHTNEEKLPGRVPPDIPFRRNSEGSPTSPDNTQCDIISSKMLNYLKDSRNWPEGFSVLRVSKNWRRTPSNSPTKKYSKEKTVDKGAESCNNTMNQDVPWFNSSVNEAVMKGHVTRLTADDMKRVKEKELLSLWVEWTEETMPWITAARKLRHKFYHNQASGLSADTVVSEGEDIHPPIQLPNWESISAQSAEEPDLYEEQSPVSPETSGDSPCQRRNAGLPQTLEQDAVCISEASTKRRVFRRRKSQTENHPSVVYRNTLTSEELQSLNLRYGSNRAVFSVVTKYQGTCQCGCFIYLWNWTEKLVISDIDGTITKSDVRGHLMPLIGLEWVHNHVVSLYHKIASNGYRFLYLSSRSIGQARGTRSMLYALEQDGYHLPDGPILLAPFSLLRALHKEVIAHRADEFKIACLKQVRELFPINDQSSVIQFPSLVAGFGNRDTDIKTYRAVGLNNSHIFTVNRLGKVICGNDVVNGECIEKSALQATTLTYETLEKMVHHYFPKQNSVFLLP